MTASVYFSSDVANPDTYTKFYADLQMYTTTMPQPDPERFMNQFCSWEVATKDNKWQGRNITRWKNDEYDKVLPRRRGRARSGQARGDLHPHERPGDREPGGDPGRLPAARVGGGRTSCRRRSRGWDNDLWNLRDWYKDA